MPKLEGYRIRINSQKNKVLSKTFDRSEKINFRKHVPNKNIISTLEDLEDNDKA
jgi:hypothetical protein